MHPGAKNTAVLGSEEGQAVKGTAAQLILAARLASRLNNRMPISCGVENTETPKRHRCPLCLLRDLVWELRWGGPGMPPFLAHADWPRKGLGHGAFTINTEQILLPDERVKVL